MNLKSLIKRFLSGVLVGLLFTLIFGFYSAFAHVSIPLVQGLTGLLFSTISCGIIAAISNLETLTDHFPTF